MRKLLAFLAALGIVSFIAASPASAVTTYVSNSGSNNFYHHSAWYSVGSGTKYFHYKYWCSSGYSVTNVFVYAEESTSTSGVTVVKATLHQSGHNSNEGWLGFSASSTRKYRFAGTASDNNYIFEAQYPSVCSFRFTLESS